MIKYYFPSVSEIELSALKAELETLPDGNTKHIIMRIIWHCEMSDEHGPKR